MPEIMEQPEKPIGAEMLPDQPDELAVRLAQKEETLQQATRRIAELEQLVTELEEKAASLEKSLAESEQKLAEAERAFSLAVASYTAQIIEANPQIPAELITGETIEAVDSSLKTARTLINKIKEGLEAEIKTARIPAGAPPRVPIDFSSLSPREKIQHGIGGH